MKTQEKMVVLTKAQYRQEGDGRVVDFGKKETDHSRKSESHKQRISVVVTFTDEGKDLVSESCGSGT